MLSFARRHVRLLWGVVIILLAGGIAAGAVRLRALPNERRVDALQSAPVKARESGAVSITMVITLARPDGELLSVTASAQLNAKEERAHVELPQVIGPGGLELVSQGSIMYLSIPEGRREPLGNKRWVRVNAGSAAGAQGAVVEPLPDPISYMAALEGVKGEVRSLGTAEVDGVATDHYRANVSLETLASRLGPRRIAHARALARLGLERLPVEAWIDDDGLPRQLVVRADLDDQGRVVATLKFGNFGEAFLIGVPPNDAVHPAADVDEALSLVSS